MDNAARLRKREASIKCLLPADGEPHSLLGREVAKLSEAECLEVSGYVEIMRSLRREGASRGLFGDGFARRIPAMCDGARQPPTASPASQNQIESIPYLNQS